MNAADRITPKFHAARGKLEDKLFADEYVLEGMVPVDDGYGGRVMTRVEIERDRCKLEVSGRLGGPIVRDGVVVEVAPMRALLPYDSQIEPTHELTINGRAMRVLDVRRGGEWGLFTEVEIEERV